ncbi:DUF4184 family protein [Streptomyces sp. NPDC056987]|uniref:DUF4184 family protein n=1 Tax=Streptomyces sp. NPDC056987 TaxID=3345988 RepID=UPI00363650C2
MPFTLSHPAAVLPLLRHPFSPAALVCGAVAPDVPYFLVAARIPVSAQSWYEPFLNATSSHTLSGVTVAVPLALALLALYRLVRPPAVALLPARFSPDGPADRGRQGFRPRRTGWVLLSALTGVLTHLLWDSFTHADGYAVTQLSVLRAHLTEDLTVARVVQHLSTAGGLIAVAAHLWRRPRQLRRAPARDARRTVLPATARRGIRAAPAVAALVGAVANTQSLEEYRGGPAAADRIPTRQMVEAVLSDTVTGAGAALACALVLYAAAWWAYRTIRPAVPYDDVRVHQSS